jgi:hypothetical protein
MPVKAKGDILYLTVAVSKDEMRQIEARAKADDRPKSVWARTVLRRELGKQNGARNRSRKT